MNILRWTLGGVAALLLTTWMFGFVISIVFDNEIWRERARSSRAWLGVLALAWFNIEIWGRVVYTLVHWT